MGTRAGYPEVPRKRVASVRLRAYAAAAGFGRGGVRGDTARRRTVLVRLLRYAYRLEPRTLALGLSARVLIAALTVAAPILVGQAIGRLPDAIARGADPAFIAVLAALLTVLLLNNVLGLVGETTATRISGTVEKDCTLRMGHAVSSRPGLATLDDPDVMSRVQKVRGRRWEIDVSVRQAQGPVIAQVLSLVGTAVALGITANWWLPAAMVAGWVGETVFVSRLIAREMDLWSGQTEPQKHAWYAFQQGMGKSAKEIRIFGLAGYFRQRHWDNMTAAFAPYWRRRRRNAVTNVAVMGGRVLITAGSLAYTGWQAGRGGLGLTQVATALPLILSIGQADTWMFGMIGRGSAVLTWLEELAIADPSSGVPVARAAARAPVEAPVTTGTPPEIVFDDVTFTYPRADNPILSGLSMTLPSGEAVALVGVNGAGKSTLVKLLAGTYAPDHGRVLVDGVDLATLDDDARARWQRRVAPITQDFIRLPLCAGDNVELGTGQTWAGRIDLDTWPGAAALDATALERTARRAGITDLIERLPSGWKTPLDKTITGGTDLSGGEWQRIGLARALRAVAVGADVLVLDEPAAALDVQAESRLVDGYLDLAQHVTSLVISHRFSVVRPVPLIYVLESGRIVERGSHAELMVVDGRYRTMFSLQASRYVEAAEAADRSGAES